MEESLDCAIIGAGLSGLGVAKQYHCIRPDDSLAIFEHESSIGGTWANQRLYPEIKTNNLHGTYEFPDYPMSSARFGIADGKHIPGKVVHAYLKEYAATFGIDSSIRLNTRVLSAEHQSAGGGGWILTTQSADRETRIFARRLIVATGLTSEAFVTAFKGQDHFGGKIFHGKHFLQNEDTLRTAKSVTVVGGSKLVWDAVYAYVRAGVDVDWVIRPGGRGPCWISPPYVTPFKRWIEKLANTRLLTWFSPCIWGEADGFPRARRFLHNSALGRLIVKLFWKILGNDVMSLNKYDLHPETAKLKPWIGAMFVGNSFSILNYECDFFELVKSGKVKIHIDEIDHLSPGKVHLSDGTVYDSDAILAHTGWKQAPPLKFLPSGIEEELGIPYLQREEGSDAIQAKQLDLLDRADEKILRSFPQLMDGPKTEKRCTALVGWAVTDNQDSSFRPGLSPFMLHRFMVPPFERFLRHRDIAFAGMLGNFSTTLTAHLQGLWIAAYFGGLLENDPSSVIWERASLDELQYQTALHNRFGKWRYPIDWGEKAPSFIFDAVPYLDLLQRDLGLNPHRKSWILSEMLSPYGPDDYCQINREWEQKLSLTTKRH